MLIEVRADKLNLTAVCSLLMYYNFDSLAVDVVVFDFMVL